MSFKPYAIRNRSALSDAQRKEGFAYYGNKSYPGELYNEVMFKSNQDHVLGTEVQCVTQGLADIYYASTGDFKDKDGNIVTLLDYDRINIIIDVMERDIVFPAVKLDFQCHQLTDMNGYDMTIQDEVSGRIELDIGGFLNVSGQSNLLKTSKQHEIEYLDVDSLGANNYQGIWSFGNFVLVACGADGLRSYSIGAGGILTAVDVDFQSGFYLDVWSDGTFIFVAADTSGLLTYSIDGSGVLTYIDSDFQAGGSYKRVFGDGAFIYTAAASSGIRSYSVNGIGVLTYIDVDKQGASDYVDVHSNGTYIFIADQLNGIRSYSVDGSGILAYISLDSTGAGNFRSVWSNSNYAFCGCDDGLRSYDIDVSGNLSFNDANDPGFDFMFGLFGLGNYIYVSASTDGILSFYIEADGSIKYFGQNDQAGNEQAVYGDSNFLYTSSSTDGLRSYRKLGNDFYINFSGTGTILDGGNVVTP